MSDITKCKGANCLVRESCYRYTAVANPYYQSYFADYDAKVKRQKDCEYFIKNKPE